MYDWTNKDIEQEKTVVINEIIEKESYLDVNRFIEWALWKNNPLCLPICGTEESVSNIALTDVVEYKKNAFRKDNMFFLISGRITTQDIKLIKEIISAIKPGYGRKLSPRVIPDKTTKPKISFVKTKNDFMNVAISFKNNNDVASIETLVLLSSIIGGGYGALLQRLVRDKLGLLYDLFSDVNVYEDMAVLQIQCSVHNKNLIEVLHTIFDTINKTKENIPQEEMMINTPFFTDNLWFWKEDPGLFNEIIGGEIVFGGVGKEPIQEKIDKYLSITKEQIIDAAKGLFTVNNTYVLIIGATGRFTKGEILECVRILERP